MSFQHRINLLAMRIARLEEILKDKLEEKEQEDGTARPSEGSRGAKSGSAQ